MTTICRRPLAEVTLMRSAPAHWKYRFVVEPGAQKRRLDNRVEVAIPADDAVFLQVEEKVHHRMDGGI